MERSTARLTTRTRRGAAVVGATALVLALGACSKTESSGGTTGTTATGGATTSAAKAGSSTTKAEGGSSTTKAGGGTATTSAGGQEITVTGDQTISEKVGQTFTLKVESNPTTGYLWSAKSTGDSIKAKGSDTVSAPAGSPPGAGGYQTFTYEAVAAGQSVITLNYTQAGSTTPGKTYKVTVDVS